MQHETPTPDERAADFHRTWTGVQIGGHNVVRFCDGLAATIREASDAARADEREACAKLCIDLRHPRGYSSETEDWIAGTDHCADAIRARSTEER